VHINLQLHKHTFAESWSWRNNTTGSTARRRTNTAAMHISYRSIQTTKGQVTTASTSTLWTTSNTYTCRQFFKWIIYTTTTNRSRFTSFPKNTHKIQSQETIFFTTKTHDWH